MDEAVDTLVTLGDWIRYAATIFARAELVYGHGTEEALDEAVALVVSALGLGPEPPPVYHAARLLREERERLAELVRLRVETRRPVAYLTHEAYFAGLRFYVDERVLIPRSPLAELITARFEPWVDAERIGRILDLGTGSGALAVAVAMAFPEAHVLATDLSSDALAVAALNVRRHGLDRRITLRQGSLYHALLASDGPFDLIISNPPYVPESLKGHLPPEHTHEPALALWAGVDGLAILRPLLAEAGAWLAPGHGLLAVECGDVAPVLRAELVGEGFVWPELECGRRDILLAEQAALVAHREGKRRAG